MYLQAKEARKKAIEDMDPETRAAFENMRFYKFYPVQTPDTPDISNVKVRADCVCAYTGIMCAQWVLQLFLFGGLVYMFLL